MTAFTLSMMKFLPNSNLPASLVFGPSMMALPHGPTPASLARADTDGAAS
jgi:hypothetical protein